LLILPQPKDKETS